MTDIVERLRLGDFSPFSGEYIKDADKDEAADEIERLRRMITAIWVKVPLDLLRDENGNDKSPVDAVDAMMIEIVSLRYQLRKALEGK